VADLATEGRDAFVRFWSSVHEATYRMSGGRALTRILGMSVVQLTTVGRRSGRLRSTILTAPIAEEERIVLVASNGGDDRNPQWYLNMMAQPTVGVVCEGVEREFEGRVAYGSERSDLWRTIRTVTPIYQLHQRRTSRELPVVVLEASYLRPDPTA